MLQLKSIILGDGIFEVGLFVLLLLFFNLYKNYKKKRYSKSLITTENQKISSKNVMQEKDDNYISKTSENPKPKLISDIKELEILEKLKAFEKSTNFINKNFTLSTLAFFLKTNPKYTTYILKLHRNKNFNDYINGLKIQYIIKLMNEDSKYLNYKIIYLAEICGFSTHSRFTQIFKNEVGMAPSQYISELKKKNDRLKKL